MFLHGLFKLVDALLVHRVSEFRNSLLLAVGSKSTIVERRERTCLQNLVAWDSSRQSVFEASASVRILVTQHGILLALINHLSHILGDCLISHRVKSTLVVQPESLQALSILLSGLLLYHKGATLIVKECGLIG